jgi:hypothetical protein
MYPIGDIIEWMSPVGILPTFLFVLCIILLCVKKRMPNLIFGLFICAWYLSFLAITSGIIRFLDIDIWYIDEKQYEFFNVFYASLLPAIVLSIPLFILSIKRRLLKHLSKYSWFAIFLMIAFIDIILLWRFCFYCIRCMGQGPSA